MFQKINKFIESQSFNNHFYLMQLSIPFYRMIHLNEKI